MHIVMPGVLSIVVRGQYQSIFCTSHCGMRPVSELQNAYCPNVSASHCGMRPVSELQNAHCPNVGASRCGKRVYQSYGMYSHKVSLLW